MNELSFIETEHGIFTENKITGQTAEEVYQEWLNNNFDLVDGEYIPKQIDICPKEIKTNEQLTDENKLLKAQVEALSANQDFYEECIVEMATLVYA